MSAGIAESGSLARLPVLIRELPEYIAAARTRLEKFMGSAVKRGKLDADERDAALASVTFTSELKEDLYMHAMVTGYRDELQRQVPGETPRRTVLIDSLLHGRILDDWSLMGSCQPSSAATSGSLCGHRRRASRRRHRGSPRHRKQARQSGRVFSVAGRDGVVGGHRRADQSRCDDIDDCDRQSAHRGFAPGPSGQRHRMQPIHRLRPPAWIASSR
jgi:hypothetical protein